MLRLTSLCLIACLIGTAFATYQAQPSSFGPWIAAEAADTQAVAGASSNDAGAKAAAGRIRTFDWQKIYNFGHKIGEPLLVEQSGPLTSLRAAALPARSWVGRIEPAFVRDNYGRVQFISGSSLGMLAI